MNAAEAANDRTAYYGAFLGAVAAGGGIIAGVPLIPPQIKAFGIALNLGANLGKEIVTNGGNITDAATFLWNDLQKQFVGESTQQSNPNLVFNQAAKDWAIQADAGIPVIALPASPSNLPRGNSASYVTYNDLHTASLNSNGTLSDIVFLENARGNPITVKDIKQVNGLQNTADNAIPVNVRLMVPTKTGDWLAVSTAKVTQSYNSVTGEQSTLVNNGDGTNTLLEMNRLANGTYVNRLARVNEGGVIEENITPASNGYGTSFTQPNTSSVFALGTTTSDPTPSLPGTPDATNGGPSITNNNLVSTGDYTVGIGNFWDVNTAAGNQALAGYAHLLAVLLGSMLIVALIINPLIVWCKIRRNPYPLVLMCLRESGVTAFFTRSSAANIPINLAIAKRLKLDADTYSVAIPLGATINMAGAAITISVLSLAAANTLGIVVDIPTAILLCVVASVCACGASGVAGGSLLLIPLACSLFGISNDIAMQVVAIGFIIGVLQDSAETALNSSTDVIFTAAVCMAEEERNS